MNKRILIRLVVLLFTLHSSLFTSAQQIKDGSKWWDGKRLYVAIVDDEGDVRMEGESVDMGGDSFALNKVAKSG